MSQSVVRRIEEVESHLGKCKERLDSIERSLRLCTLTDQERCNLEEEEMSLQKMVEKHSKELQSLRFDNFKNAMISFIVMALIGGVYVIYSS